MLGSLLILLAMPILDTSRIRGSQFRPLMRFAFWAFVTDFFLLMYIGSCHAEEPYITIGAAATAFYFGWFIVIVPVIGIIENTLADIATEAETPTASSSSIPLSKMARNFGPISFLGVGTRNYSTSVVSNLLAARANLKVQMVSFVMPDWVDVGVFRQIANGLFQAEGHISCRIVNGKFFAPVFVINQNLTDSSLEFFLTLWHVLGRVGNLTITESYNSNIVISFRSESWDYILGTLMEFFNLCYGEKFVAFHKLVLIQKLLALKDTASKTQAVCLVYSLALSGTSRLLSLKEQLANISSVDPLPLISNFAHNTLVPSIPFIMGFIIGDGSMLIRLRLVSSSVWIVPQVLFPQKDTSDNLAFLSILKDYFAFIGISSTISHKSGMILLQVEGIKSVFELLVQLCLPYARYFYWKLAQFEELLEVSRLVLSNAHSSLYGMLKVLTIMFNYERQRQFTLEYWQDIVTNMFVAKGKGNASGEYMIKAVNGRKGVEKGRPIAWKVDFPDNCKASDPLGHLSNSQFRFYDDLGKVEALDKAILHRDTQLKLWVDSLTSSVS